MAALASGEIAIIVGTHALFQKDVAFHDLRLAVVDEQHRFGVAQRMELGAKGETADVLVMTATPIPRSLALASYGDMDVSVLDEKPPGRKPIKTALISADRIGEVVDHLRQAIAEGRQAYWVCPLVMESETLTLTAAEDRFQRLRAALGEGVVGLVHGQLPQSEKDAAMADFVAGRDAGAGRNHGHRGRRQCPERDDHGDRRRRDLWAGAACTSCAAGSGAARLIRPVC